MLPRCIPHRRVGVFVLLFVSFAVSPAFPQARFFTRGDGNADGALDISDPVATLGFLFLGDAPPACLDAVDANDDGVPDLSDAIYSLAFQFLGGAPPPPPFGECGEDPTADALNCQSYPACPQLPPATSIVRTSPQNGEDGVAVTRETVVEFDLPLLAGSVTSDAIFAQFAGERLDARIHLSSSRQVATLFYSAPLPASARVRVTVDGDLLLDDEGRPVDADGDEEPGGVKIFDFDTLTLTSTPDTIVVGRIFASELDDDGDGGSINEPLAGVTITVDGMEGTLRAVTDAKGDFRLENAPAGRFFVHIDGSTATNGVPEGAYYPTVGKAWESVIGQETIVGDVFLPLIRPGTLQPVSEEVETAITFPDEVLADFPELEGVELFVPPGSLHHDDGTPGTLVGIAPVPPDRIPGQLPPGLGFAIVITIQTGGATNFDVPVPACFPNLPDPETGETLPPGASSALWSFNHDSGRFEVVGPMTVSADGLLVCTDPGVGITAPGWHGQDPGSEMDPEEPECPDFGWGDVWTLAGAVKDCIADMTRMLQIIGSVFDVIDSIHTLYDRIQDLRRGFEDGSLDREDVLAALEGLRAIKNGAKSVYDTWTAQNPVSKVLDVISCANDIVQAINDILCERADCAGPVARFICSKIQPLLRLANSLLDKAEDLERGLRNAPMAFACAAFDALIALIQVSGDGDAAGAVPTDAEILAAMDAFLGTSTQFDADLSTPVTETCATIEELAGESVDLDENGTTQMISAVGGFPNAYYLLRVAGSEQRGQTNASGRFQLLVPPSTDYELLIFDAANNALAISSGRTPPNGVRGTVAPFSIQLLADEPDSDLDGLSDAAEEVVGTRVDDPDTDADGVPDGAEVRQGTDPLDCLPGGRCLTARTGLIGTADTPGSASDVCAVNDIAIVADQSAGISVFNVFNGMEPTVIARIDTPGFASAVSCSSDLIAVGDGFGGLQIVDISDPPSASIVRNVPTWRLGNGGVQAVATAGNVAFVGSSSGIVAKVDMLSGSVLGRRSLGAPIQDLGVRGDYLYALVVGTLHTLRAQNGPFAPVHSVASPGIVGAGGRRLRLFVGTEFAYATHTSGYNTFSLADPAAPTRTHTCNTNQFGWKHLVDNGSGTGVAAVSPNSTNDGPHHVSIYDIRTPNSCGQLQSTANTPGLAAAVSIYNALAYAADSSAGLQVINYLPYDTGDEAPTVELSANFPLEGAVDEAKAYRVTAHVQDDVEVRNVEFFLDGNRVLVDGNFPFELHGVSPLARESDTITLQVRATDTGGNATTTEELVIPVLGEMVPPEVTEVSPADGAELLDVRTVAAFFNEPLDEASLADDALRLTAAGPDDALGTADDESIAGALSYQVDSSGLFLTLAEPLVPGLYGASLADSLTDVAGNPLAAPVEWTFRVLVPPFKLRVTSAQGFSGDTVDVEILMDNNEPVQGWNFGVCHDPEQLDVVSYELGDAAATVNGGFPPGFLVVGEGATRAGVAMAAVVQVAGAGTLAVGQGHSILRVRYRILADPGAETLSIDLCLCDEVDLTEGRPVDTALTVGGVVTEPALECGAILVEPRE